MLMKLTMKCWMNRDCFFLDESVDVQLNCGDERKKMFKRMSYFHAHVQNLTV